MSWWLKETSLILIICCCWAVSAEIEKEAPRLSTGQDAKTLINPLNFLYSKYTTAKPADATKVVVVKPPYRPQYYYPPKYPYPPAKWPKPSKPSQQTHHHYHHHYGSELPEYVCPPNYVFVSWYNSAPGNPIGACIANKYHGNDNGNGNNCKSCKGRHCNNCHGNNGNSNNGNGNNGNGNNGNGNNGNSNNGNGNTGNGNNGNGNNGNNGGNNNNGNGNNGNTNNDKGNNDNNDRNNGKGNNGKGNNGNNNNSNGNTGNNNNGNGNNGNKNQGNDANGNFDNNSSDAAKRYDAANNNADTGNTGPNSIITALNSTATNLLNANGLRFYLRGPINSYSADEYSGDSLSEVPEEYNDYDTEAASRSAAKNDDSSITEFKEENGNGDFVVDTKDVKLPFAIHVGSQAISIPLSSDSIFADQETLIYLKNLRSGRKLAIN